MKRYLLTSFILHVIAFSVLVYVKEEPEKVDLDSLLEERGLADKKKKPKE